MHLKRFVLYALLGVSVCAGRASAQDPRTLIHPGAAAQSQGAPSGTPPLRQLTSPQQTVENGQICTTFTFEGVGNLAPIPVFDGISSPGWLGIIDADAGGSGNFAFEPSPQTIAFWLGGAPSREIILADPASRLEFRYASFVPIILQAFDRNGNLIQMATGPANWRQGPGGDPRGTFNRWDPISVQSARSDIARVLVSGNVNQTGIDDLKVCRELAIHAVEITQAIQEFQTIADLEADLQNDREPPVPIIAGKPAVLRVYFDAAQASITVKVEATLPGGQQTRQIRLQPGCTPEQQRRGDNGCQSLDFYFLPGGGNWDARVRLLTGQGQEIQKHDLPLHSRGADILNLRAVSVCDARQQVLFLRIWQCARAADLGGMVDFLRRIAPTGSVTVSVTDSVVRRDAATYDANGDGTVTGREASLWWSDTVGEVGDLFGLFDRAFDLLGTKRHYYGMVRSQAPGTAGGMADDIPSHGAMSRVSTVRFNSEINFETVAHETGHMLGLRHTNTEAPSTEAAPGCYNLAFDDGTDWPFGDNYIQSAARREVGFDVANRRAVDPDDHFELMSYCTPRWISPHSYVRAMPSLDADFAFAALEATAPGEYWTVSGVFREQLGLLLGPVYRFRTTGPTEEGLGDYRIEVRGSGGQVLFTRRFTPTVATTETAGEAIEGDPRFFELVPVQPGAGAIVVLSPAGAVLGSVTFGGAAPRVRITFPSSGPSLFGVQKLTWSIHDEDSTRHWSAVDLSTDGGQTWFRLGETGGEPFLLVDFDQVPGAASALLRVTVSDGANSGSTSTAFSVPPKTPAVEILGPAAGEVFRLGDLVWMRAHAYDTDDGILDDEAVRWTSSLDGALGTGASLPVTILSGGRHTLTVEATDRAGNTASATVEVVVAAAPPSLRLTVLPLDELPTTCVRVTIDAEPGSDLANLTRVEYSLTGGDTWIPVPPDTLPFRFLVPGAGYFHLVARVFDAAGQMDVQDERFLIDSPCQMNVNLLPPVADAGPDFTVACSGTGPTPVALDGSGSHDPEGQPLTYAWTGPFGTAAGVSPTVGLPLGPSTVELTVGDGELDSEPDTATVTVEVGVEGLLPPMAALVPEGQVPPFPRSFRLGGTIPLKLRLSCGDELLTEGDVAAPAVAGLSLNSTPIPLYGLDLHAGNSNGGDPAFHSSEDLWIYNLDTSALLPGSWTITIGLPDGRRVCAGFVLR